MSEFRCSERSCEPIALQGKGLLYFTFEQVVSVDFPFSNRLPAGDSSSGNLFPSHGSPKYDGKLDGHLQKSQGRLQKSYEEDLESLF